MDDSGGEDDEEGKGRRGRNVQGRVEAQEWAVRGAVDPDADPVEEPRRAWRQQDCVDGRSFRIHTPTLTLISDQQEAAETGRVQPDRDKSGTVGLWLSRLMQCQRAQRRRERVIVPERTKT